MNGVIGVIIKLAGFGLLMSLCACQRTPEFIEKDGVITAEETIQAGSADESDNFEIPQCIEDEWMIGDQSVVLAADIYAASEKITKGSLIKTAIDSVRCKDIFGFDKNAREFTDQQIEGQYGYEVVNKNEVIKKIVLSRTKCDYLEFQNMSIDEYFTGIDMEKCSVDEIWNLENVRQWKTDMQEMLKKLNINHKISDIYILYGSCKGEKCAYLRTVLEIDNVPVFEDNGISVGAEEIYVSGSIAVSDRGINRLIIASNYQKDISKESEVQALPFSQMLGHVKRLFEEGTLGIRQNEIDYVISRIELEYNLKKDGDEIIYYPVWVFYKNYGDNNLIPYLAINAENGAIDYWNE